MRSVVRWLVAGVLAGGMCGGQAALAGAYIPGVPDVNQPPTNTLGVPRVTNYCAPMAAVNITEYWDVVKQDPNAAGVDAGLAARTAAEYIGYFMDTNNFGSPARANGTGLPAASGTYVIDELPGLSDFVRWDVTHPFTTPPPNLPAGKVGYDWTFTYTDITTVGSPAGFAFCATEIDAGRPVKIDFTYWNPILAGTQMTDPASGDTIQFCEWGPPESGSQDPDHTEEWNFQEGPAGIGHAVTGVGYFRQIDPDGTGPLPLSDYIVVHDNWANTPVHLAIAWANWNAAIAVRVRNSAYIANVPDTNQPPTNTLGMPHVTNYCAPMAAVNITQYWDVVMQDPQAVGVDAGLAARTAAEYIAYFMDTNNFGSPVRLNGNGLPQANGTYVIDEVPGFGEYVRWDASHLFTTPPPNLPAGKVGYDWNFAYTDIVIGTLAAGFEFCVTEIDAGRPLKLDFLYWNPIPTGIQVIDPNSGDTIEFYDWGPPESGSQDPEHTEQWNLEEGPNGIGHAVTGVGYFRQIDPDGAGPLPMTDYIVVHDNWANTAVNVAIAWANWNAAISVDVGEPTSVVFSEDFNDCDISDWEVHVQNPPADKFQVDQQIYHAAPCGLAMYSQGEGYAYGLTRELDLDLEEDYQIDFWFMIPDENNHWFLVMDDGYVHVVIDYYNELSTWDGTTVQLLTYLTAGQWYNIRCEVHPSRSNYDVHVDDALMGTAGLLSAHMGRLRLGDIHTGSYDHGAGYWDEIVVTQSGSAAVGEFPPEAPNGADGAARLCLAPSWPNPSRAASLFQYYVPAAGRVRLVVCDVTGAKVATLVDGSEAAGWHRVAWDASRLPCGVYFSRLEQGGVVRAGKVVVAR